VIAVESSGASGAEGQEFAAGLRALLDWLHVPGQGARNDVVALVQEVLGSAGLEQSVVARDLPPFEHVNLQTALDAWSAAPGRTVEVRGVALPPHYGGIDLQQLMTGEGLPPVRLSAPAVADLPNGPGSTLACLRLALLLVTDDDGRYLVLVQGPGEHRRRSASRWPGCRCTGRRPSWPSSTGCGGSSTSTAAGSSRSPRRRWAASR
jgi:hypothetical protein